MRVCISISLSLGSSITITTRVFSFLTTMAVLAFFFYFPVFVVCEPIFRNGTFHQNPFDQKPFNLHLEFHLNPKP